MRRVSRSIAKKTRPRREQVSRVTQGQQEFSGLVSERWCPRPRLVGMCSATGLACAQEGSMRGGWTGSSPRNDKVILKVVGKERAGT